jgi:hypothetical protein
MSDLDQAIEKLVREAAELAAKDWWQGDDDNFERVVKRAFLAPMQEFVREQAALAVAGAYEAAAQSAWKTPFRAHAEDDVDYHSGCEQTQRRIIAAIRALTPADAQKAQAERMQKLTALAQTWRTKYENTLNQPTSHGVSDLAKGRADGYSICADELEAALREIGK